MKLKFMQCLHEKSKAIFTHYLPKRQVLHEKDFNSYEQMCAEYLHHKQRS